MSVTQITLNGETINLVALPATPGLRAVNWTMFDGVGVSRAPFTGAVQAQRWHGGDMWSGVAQVPPLGKADADNWIAALEELRGVANAFQMGDPSQPLPRGSVAGAPAVDGTLNNGNQAGSLFLGTKGWTPNAQGVLFPGDYLQVGFRLYRALDFVNADANGQAVFPIWSSLREQPLDVGLISSPVSSTSNAFGTAGKFSSQSLVGYNAGVMWGFFTIPSLPADAVIQGIYPVIVASAVWDICFQVLRYGPGLIFDAGPTGSLFNYPPSLAPEPDQTFSSTEFYDLGPSTGPLAGKGIGTTLSDLAGQEIMMLLASSLLETPIYDTFTATAVGFGVYYTSATPTTDAQIPPPFTVPAGQGLAWSLPLNATVNFSPITGYARGSPSSRINVIGPQGIWRLTDNKRNYAIDAEHATPLSFPFKEYR